MKRGLLNKIIQPYAGLWRLFAANGGMVIGLAGLLLAIQLHFDFKKIFNPSQPEGGDYLILTRSIGIGDTLSLNSPSFTEEQISLVKEQPFVKGFGEIQRGDFKVMIPSSGLLGQRSDLFLESAPIGMLDLAPAHWDWKEGDPVLPAIMSNDFFNLYNFVFAPIQGLPPLTRSALKMFNVILEVGEGVHKTEISARIVGFSHRISSILAPRSFIQWANKKYGSGKKIAPSRVIIKVDDATDPAISAFLRTNGLETNQDQLRGDRTEAAARIAVIVTAIISLLIAALSVLSTAMNTQLIISQSAKAISLLMQLGYKPKVLARWLLKKHAYVLLTAVLLASLVFVLCLGEIRVLFRDSGFSPPTGFENAVYIFLPVFLTLLIYFQFLAIWSSIKRSMH